jgi:hypothetical protein
MFGDKKLLWVIEYFLGLVILAIVMPLIIHTHPGWSGAHGWAYLLFLACCSITLISSAGAMRQRIHLAARIAKLEQMAEDMKRSGSQTNSNSTQKRTAKEQFVGSVN